MHVGPEEGLVLLAVSAQSVPRVLRLLQAVSLEVDRRGWQLFPNDGRGWKEARGVAVQIGRERYPLKIREDADSAAFTEADKRRWRRENPWGALPDAARKLVPNGRLTLSIVGVTDGGRSNWTDGPRGQIECKLASFFETLETRSARDAERSAERERITAGREARHAEAAAEHAQTELFRSQCEAWHTAERARAFVRAIRMRLSENSLADAAAIEEWCRRGESWADEHDPLATLFA